MWLLRTGFPSLIVHGYSGMSYTKFWTQKAEWKQGDIIVIVNEKLKISARWSDTHKSK